MLQIIRPSYSKYGKTKDASLVFKHFQNLLKITKYLHDRSTWYFLSKILLFIIILSYLSNLLSSTNQKRIRAGISYGF